MTQEEMNRQMNDALDAIFDQARELRNPDWLSEIIDSGSQIPPRLLAQMLMNELGVMGEPTYMDEDRKKYWIEVADHMGPDWIAGLRKHAAFMSKVEEF